MTKTTGTPCSLRAAAHRIVRVPLLRGLAAVAAVGLQLAVQTPPDRTSVRTVPAVNLERYAGTWYEIARLPNGLQEQCASDATARYTLRPDGRIAILNRCRRADGTLAETRGLARRAANDPSNAKLQVRFAPALLAMLPMSWGNYWILGLSTDYHWAVVGEPSIKHLWILSRAPALPDSSYAQAIAIAKANGYDVTNVIRTPHSRYDAAPDRQTSTPTGQLTPVPPSPQ